MRALRMREALQKNEKARAAFKSVAEVMAKLQAPTLKHELPNT